MYAFVSNEFLKHVQKTPKSWEKICSITIFHQNPKKWVGRAMGNETFYGDGLKLSRDKLKLLRDNLSKKKLYVRTVLFPVAL